MFPATEADEYYSEAKEGGEGMEPPGLFGGNLEFRNIIFHYPCDLSSTLTSTSLPSSSSSSSSPRHSIFLQNHFLQSQKSTYSPFTHLFPPPSLPTKLQHLTSSSSPSPSFCLEIESLHISYGQFVAIVGPPGSGKTTLFNLLLRLYEPTEGLILFDGLDVRNICVEWLRSHIG